MTRKIQPSPGPESEVESAHRLAIAELERKFAVRLEEQRQANLRMSQALTARERELAAQLLAAQQTALRTSQSALCTQVKQLESALGETLYRRSGRSIVLTDFGQLIRGYAEEVFAIARAARIMAIEPRVLTPRRIPEWRRVAAETLATYAAICGAT